MRFYGFALFLSMAAVAETLEDFRWQKRLLVVTANNQDLVAEITPELAGLAERDVRIFVLDGPAPFGAVPGPALAKELRERLKVREGVAEVLLLGKDGNTTLRWKAGQFSVAALFGKIDVMPMRRQEIKKQQSE